MRTALEVKTTILPGGKIEIVDPDLPPGESVDVIVLLRPALPRTGRSAVDILANVEGGRLFKSAEEVRDDLQQERDAWQD